MLAVRDFRELERAYGNQVSRKMNYRPPNVASTPNPETKYGVYICGRLDRKNGEVLFIREVANRFSENTRSKSHDHHWP